MTSSIGEGLRDIEERGIDAHLEQDMAPKKKRRKGTSPTARTLAECRKRGWITGVVEKFVKFPPPGHHVDFLGVIDLIAVVPSRPSPHIGGGLTVHQGAIVGIQACSGGLTGGGNTAHRRDKIIAEPRALAWVEAGGRLELWSWGLRKQGKAKRWTLRTERFEVRDGKLVGIEGP